MPRRRKALRRLGGIVLLTVAGAAFAAPGGSCPIPPGRAEGQAPANEAETADSLLDQEAWTRESAQALPERTLEPGRVAAILQTLKPPERKLSLWDRFMLWLNSLFVRDDRPAQPPQWLLKLIKAIPPWFGKAVFFTLLAAIVIGLAAIVFIELRAAGVFRRRPRVGAAPVATATPAAATEALPDLGAIARLPLREQPAALLQWTIRRLVARQVLPVDRSLTNGELLTLVGARAPDELPAFRRLARAAEAVVYGGRAPGERETRELLDLLHAPAAAAR